MSYQDIPGRLGDFVQNYDRLAGASPRRVVDVGLGLGKSVAYAATRLSAEDMLWGVDPFYGTDINGEQQSMAADAGGCFPLFLKQMMGHCPDQLAGLMLIRETSLTAARMFDDGTLDLVQLDALHTYEGVSADIRAWLPKVRPGGVIGGDDFVPDFPGVQQAVREAFGDDFDVLGSAWQGWRHVKR